MSLFSIAAKFALKGASKRVPEDIMSGTIRRIKQGGQVSEGLSSIVSRANGGNLSFEDKMYEHAMRILNRETLNPSFYHSNIRDERGIKDPVNFLFGTAFEDEEDESDKFYYMEAMKAAKRDPVEAEKKWNIAKSFDSDSASKDNWRVIGRDPFKDTGYKVVQDEQGREWSELDGAAIDTTSGLKHGGQPMPGGLSNINMIKRKLGGGLSGEPRTIAQAKAMGKTYFINKDGKKLAAVTREDLKRTGLSLGEYINKQNEFNKLIQSITPGLKPTQDLPTPIQEKLGKGIKERDYKITNPLLDRLHGYLRDPNRTPLGDISGDESTPTSVSPTSQQMDTWRDATARGAQLGQMKTGIGERYLGAFLSPKTLDVGTDPVTGGSFATLDDAAIDIEGAFKHGGGLSNLKKSININGQPHSLAWINPDEASALKAMGGSGKPGPMGIPSYQYDPSMGDLGEFGGLENYDPEPPQTTTISDDSDSGDTTTTSDAVYAAQQKKMLADADAMERQYGDAYALQRSIDEESPTGYLESYGGGEGITSESLMKKGIPKKLVPYWNALKDRGLSNEEAAARLAGMGTAGLASMEEAYDTGYSFGGPMGTMEGIQRDIASDYAKKLKLKEHLEKLEGLEGKELSEEDMETRREELISAFRDHAKEIGGKFIPSTKFGGIMSGWEDTLKRAGKEDSLLHKGLGYLAPGALMTKIGARGLNALTKAFGVIGEFITPEGLSYRVMDDGTLVAPDTYADTDEGTVERKPIRRPPPLAPPPEPLEQKLTGMEAHYANLPKAASRQASLQSQFDILAATYGREQAAALLNQPVNIFA